MGGKKAFTTGTPAWGLDGSWIADCGANPMITGMGGYRRHTPCFPSLVSQCRQSAQVPGITSIGMSSLVSMSFLNPVHETSTPRLVAERRRNQPVWPQLGGREVFHDS